MYFYNIINTYNFISNLTTLLIYLGKMLFEQLHKDHQPRPGIKLAFLFSLLPVYYYVILNKTSRYQQLVYES